MQEGTRRAAIYVRMSQDRSGQEYGVTRQREHSEELIKRRGWTLVETFQDNDLSAAGKRKRPGFDALIKAVESGQVSAVVGRDWTRICRNRRDELRLIDAGREARIVVACYAAGDVDLGTAIGRAWAEQQASWARLEIEQKAERQVEANLQAAQQGRRSGGRRPFGYEQDGMTVREDEADAIRRAYRDVLAGVRLPGIAREWNGAGLFTGKEVRSPRRALQDVSRWDRTTVRQVLMNPRNAGLRAYKGEVMGPAVWPALVEEETWRAVGAVLDSPSRRRAPTRSKFLLTGVALCGVCGATVHGGGARRHYRTYRCSASLGHVSRMAEPIEGHVTAVIVERLSRADAADLLVDHDRPDVDQLREDASALRARLDALATEFADGDLTASQLRTATERIRTRLAEKEAEMADAGRADLLGPLVHSGDVRAVWEGLSPDRQRAVISTLLRVRVDPVGRGVRTFRPASVRLEWITGSTF